MRKKGFTLIELLAVIVILAIISLIAIPIILNIIEKTKKSAFLDSVYGLIESTKLLYTENILKDENSSNQVFEFGEGKTNELKYNGTSPKGGSIVLMSDGKIEVAIHNNEWCAMKGFYENQVTLVKYQEEKCVLSENDDDPIISLNGDAMTYVELGDTYTELGAKATTRGGKILEYTSEIEQDGLKLTSIDTTKEGTYKIIYKVSNNNKTVIITRTVVVLNMSPFITMTDSNEVFEQEKEILITVSAIRPNKIESFSYEIKKNGVQINIETVSKLTKTLTLNETGIYEVIVTVIDNHGHTSTLSKTYKIGIAEANRPDLTNGLVPIKWNGSSWIKADNENKLGPNQWYDYNSQMWANAASVTEEYRNVAVGSTIPESAINAYFVWIPRYEYDYVNIENYAGGNAEQPGQININFIATGKTSPSSNYKVHPAFTFGSTELAGFWVGKFETTGNASTPTIKPNLSSFRNQRVASQFTISKKFSASGNNYGISESADAHLMKNSEWGAVAYLSQSKYGKYGNSSYSGANKEVYINNNSNYITGCSAGAPSALNSSSCSYTYEKSLEGTGASTSGTIYGVYDMNGGAHEYVMGIYNGKVSNSGFSSLPAIKYYDNYTTLDAKTACNGEICYGHALSETSGWYSDYAGFVGSNWTWFIRGGYYNEKTTAGIFYSFGTGMAGDSSASLSFRVVVL